MLFALRLVFHRSLGKSGKANLSSTPTDNDRRLVVVSRGTIHSTCQVVLLSMPAASHIYISAPSPKQHQVIKSYSTPKAFETGDGYRSSVFSNEYRIRGCHVC